MVHLSPARREVHISVVPGTKLLFRFAKLNLLMSHFSSVADFAASIVMCALGGTLQRNNFLAGLRYIKALAGQFDINVE